MTKTEARKELRLMRKKKLVTKKTVIAWRMIHSDQLPKNKPARPERSLTDLLRTIFGRTTIR